MDEEDFTPQTSKKRWFVLLIISVCITIRGFNQSCFGPSNSLLSAYFKVEPWQIDWLVLTQSVIFLLVALPLCLLTVRMSYRTLVLAAIFLQIIGFSLTAAGVSYQGGFLLAIAGQGFMGFSNIVSWTLPTPTAAIWFAKSEVSIAVALIVVARGVGEAMGAALPTSLTNDNSTAEEVGLTWTIMHTSLMSVAVILFVLALFIITKKPKHPPSLAQFRAEQAQQLGGQSKTLLQEIKFSLKEFRRVLKILFKDPVFVCVWLLFGATNPVLRNNNVLLSSAVGEEFEDIENINYKIGMVLMVAWIMYTIGGFIAGPLISHTHQYKLIMFVGELVLFTSCLLIFFGTFFGIINLIYFGVVLQGFIQGWCNTSVFELLAEVSYPQSTIFVTMISIICMGVFRFSYPLVGRIVMDNVSVSASTLFPCVITGICVVISAVIRPTYHRQLANSSKEEKPPIPVVSINSQSQVYDEDLI